eukprot:jgi/Astpho2/7069/e_gw1.00107.25.1_t
MYKRDVGILMLAMAGIYLSIQHEGAFNFRKAWCAMLGDLPASNLPQTVMLPLQADLNGDGRSEVIVASHTGKVQVIAPRQAGHAGHAFAQAPVLKEVSLPPTPCALLCAGQHAVALAAGYLDPAPAELVRALRKQVVVVVTAGWDVLCYDHNLRLKWQASVKSGSAERHVRVREVAIHITNHTVRAGDHGLVVVGASAEQGDLSGEDQAAQAKLSRLLVTHAATGRCRDSDTEGLDATRHFSYYAFAGDTGRLRWQHQVSCSQSRATSVACVVPQHNYRLNAAALEGRHYGEESCRDHRQAVLAAMPHSWSRLQDTSLQLAHFERQKAGTGPRRQGLATARDPLPGELPRARGMDHTNPVSAALHSVSSVPGVLHIATSGSTPRSPAVSAARKPAGPGNVLVAHLQEGMEAIHLYSGRTICRLHLQSGGLHVDLNGDGVPDHIHAIGKPSMPRPPEGSHRRHCWAVARSGIPPTSPLFNGSICRYSGPFGGITFGLGAADVTNQLEVAAPMMLPVAGPDGHVRGNRGHAVFLNSRGDVTAYTFQGRQAWQSSHGLSWSNELGQAAGLQVAPTLRPMALHSRGIPSAVLAAGAHLAVVLSEHGKELDRLELPAPPVLPIQMADFNGDGNNDLILTSRDGIYAWAQIRHPGGLPFAALVGCLIVVMAAIYLAQLSSKAEQSGPKGSRSTDRID